GMGIIPVDPDITVPADAPATATAEMTFPTHIGGPDSVIAVESATSYVTMGAVAAGSQELITAYASSVTGRTNTGDTYMVSKAYTDGVLKVYAPDFSTYLEPGQF